MRKRRSLSFGTILILLSTVVVLGGCFFLFAKMWAGRDSIRMDAKTFVNAVDDIISGSGVTASPSASPAPTIKTTVVTISPTQTTALPQEAVSQTTPTPGPSYSIALTAGGMACFRTGISEVNLLTSKKDFDFSSIFSAISPSVTGDIKLATLEGLLNGTVSKYNNIAFPQAAAAALKTAGFDTLLLNNVHALDYGTDVLTKTIDTANAAGLACAGVNAAGAKEKVFSLNGVSVALLAYADALSSRSKENAKNHSADVVSLIDAEKIMADIRAARAGGASLVVVSLHWGKEDAENVTNAQKEMAEKLAAAGADIILGANTETVLPIEMIESKSETGKTHKTLVAYSMGTLLTDSRASRSIISGILLHVRVTVTPSDGKVTFDEVTYTPTYIWKQKANGKMQFKILDSSAQAPSEMSAEQKKYMGNALNYIDKMLANGPAIRK